MTISDAPPATSHAGSLSPGQPTGAVPARAALSPAVIHQVPRPPTTPRRVLERLDVEAIRVGCERNGKLLRTA